MSKVIQEQKSTLWWIKFSNLLIECPTLKNDVFLKAFFRAAFEFNKDKISEAIKEGNCVYKQMDEKNEQLDEKNEQLDENQREIKNNLGEILKEANLFFKKFDEDEEGENEKKLKNDIIEILKLTQAVYEILNKIL